MRIAVIDDGIHEKLYPIGLVEDNIEVTPDLRIQPMSNGNQSEHGTICAAIIKKYAPGAVFTGIKILGRKETGLTTQLLAAIKWCIDQEIRLVNLSLGTIHYRDYEAIKDIVNFGYRKKLMMVAACHNKNVFTYPASLTNVIGVKCDREGGLLEGQYIYHGCPWDGIEITACGRHELIRSSGEKIMIGPANSYAAPLVTALAHNIMEADQEIGLAGIRERLSRHSQNHSVEICGEPRGRTMDWVDETVVFNLMGPGSKVSPGGDQALKVAKTVNIDCNDLTDGLAAIARYRDEDQTGWRDGPETMIIHLRGLGPDQPGRTVSEALAPYAGSWGKNLVYIDDEYQKYNFGTPLAGFPYRIWHPWMGHEFQPDSEKAKPIDVPIIVVYDFTKGNGGRLTRDLRDMFREDQYHAVAVSDLPSGVRWGLEFIPVDEGFGMEKAQNLRGLEELYRIYDFDLLILEVNALGKTESFCSDLAEAVSAEITIIFGEGPPDTVQLIVNSNDETVIAAPKSCSESVKGRKIYFIDCQGPDYGQKLYQYLLYRFENPDIGINTR